MMSDGKVSSTQTLLCNSGEQSGGSECEYGNLLVIPIDQSLLYVRPWYVKASGNSLPELQQVIVAYEDDKGNLHVAVESTFRGALVDLFGNGVPETAERNAKNVDLSMANQSGSSGSTTTTTAPSSTSTTTTSTLPAATGSQADLIRQLNAAFAEADAALKAGDFTGYAAAIERAKTIAAQLEAAGAGAGPTTTTTVP